MRHIYFVRHGETASNRQHVHQSPDEPLTEKGKEEARDAAEVLGALSHARVVTSPYTRARETATIIAESHSWHLEETELVRELRRPARLYGQFHYHPRSFTYLVNWYLKRNDAEWDDDGAENHQQLRSRVSAAQAYFAGLTGEHIIVVSHAIFINAFKLFACNNKPISITELFKLFLRVNFTDNGSITHMTYDPQSDTFAYIGDGLSS